MDRGPQDVIVGQAVESSTVAEELDGPVEDVVSLGELELGDDELGQAVALGGADGERQPRANVASGSSDGSTPRTAQPLVRIVSSSLRAIWSSEYPSHFMHMLTSIAPGCDSSAVSSENSGPWLLPSVRPAA